MIKKVAVIVLVMVASLAVAGCTVGLPSTSSPTPTATPIPTSTPTPPADYSSYYNQKIESTVGITERPFTKSTNTRGNDVYKGVGRNASMPGSKSVTFVIELTKSQAESKQLYDSYVAQRLNEGYTSRPDAVAGWTAKFGWNEVWGGQQYGSGNQYFVAYRYQPDVHSWELTTEAV